MAKTNVTTTRDSIRMGSGLRIQFQRTLRIPDNGKKYPLPPGFGPFPVRRVDDYLDRVPYEWRERGGVFIPMYQREALWILFQGEHWKPRAVKIGVGKVCAITGSGWSEQLHKRSSRRGAPQDYLVTPPQPWLDGICTGKGVIRQFVAMPLGMGYTVEGQVTGEETFGGIQIKAFEPKRGRFPDQAPYRGRVRLGMKMKMGMSAPGAPMAAPAPARSRAQSMGLAAGGKMKQKLYRDPHGLDTWDHSATTRVFVHIVNSELFREITGEEPPSTPITAKEYARNNLPWFDLYDESRPTVAATPTLAQVKSVKTLDAEYSTLPLQDDDPVSPGPITKYSVHEAAVRDGDW